MEASFRDPANALAAEGLRPRKGLGQNFLRDEPTVHAIIDSLPKAPRAIVEVGAGTGVMTRELARSRQVAAVEIDRDLARLLEGDFAGDAQIQVHAGDAMLLDLGHLLPSPYAVVGNIPYYITGALIPHILTLDPQPEWVAVLVQLEVAERLCAAPGGWSLSTLAVRVRADAEMRLSVPASAFEPRPKVDSALVMLRPHAVAEFADQEFFDFARAVFQERRKQLPNAVANAMAHDVHGARVIVTHSGLDPRRRPQTLELAEWGVLYRAFKAARSG
jgi:16S rRNA (adenine1518-N6/adenine1519-N6)-dimethyltransferase